MELATQSTLQSESTIIKLEQALGDMPLHIRTFSNAMRMRYVSEALENDEESSRKFQELRKGTKNDALVYLKGILPISEAVIHEIGNLFEYFNNLSVPQLVEQFQGMVEEFKSCRELCDMAKTLHEDLMVALKKREDDAKKVTTELRDLQEQYEKKQSDFEKAAALKRKIAIGFAFVPGVNLIVTPALLAAANSDKKDAAVHGLQAKSKDNAATAISETLQPALLAFIEALGCIAGFFSEMESEIENCEGKSRRCLIEGVLDSLYKLLKKKSSNINEKCKQFIRVIPSVKADFQFICPDDETDNTEVDHQYVFQNLTNMLTMTRRLHKPRLKITQILQRQISRQRQLANPAAVRSSSTFYTYL